MQWCFLYTVGVCSLSYCLDWLVVQDYGRKNECADRGSIGYVS
ncbi:hypothetical protein A2U01_0104043, partial [Trifolium medium]|nr:hypothetical protein [Trifolium medium]